MIDQETEEEVISAADVIETGEKTIQINVQIDGLLNALDDKGRVDLIIMLADIIDEVDQFRRFTGWLVDWLAADDADVSANVAVAIAETSDDDSLSGIIAELQKRLEARKGGDQ